MITARAPSIADAIHASLGLTEGRALVLRASRLDVTLPRGIELAREDEPADVMIAALDAASFSDAIARLGIQARPLRIAWVLPIAGASVVGWVVARARRLQPVVLEDACDALRHAGVVDVRVTRVHGALPVVVLSGRTSPA